MKSTVIGAAIVLASGSAQAVEIDISAGPNGYGCTSCYGGFNNADVAPGTTVTLISPSGGPLQRVAGPGNYTITNAETSGTFSAWNFEGYPSSSNWAWSYIIGADNGNGTATILQTGGVIATAATQAAMAGLTGTQTASYTTPLAATSTAGFTNTLTLTSQTTLDFFIDDGYLGDNGGGVALNLALVTTPTPTPIPTPTPTPTPTAPNSVPEPASAALLGLALSGLMMTRRRA